MQRVQVFSRGKTRTTQLPGSLLAGIEGPATTLLLPLVVLGKTPLESALDGENIDWRIVGDMLFLFPKDPAEQAWAARDGGEARKTGNHHAPGFYWRHPYGGHRPEWSVRSAGYGVVHTCGHLTAHPVTAWRRDALGGQPCPYCLDAAAWIAGGGDRAPS